MQVIQFIAYIKWQLSTAGEHECAINDLKNITNLLVNMSEWLNLTAFLGTADSEVHIVHISHVIIAYTLESLSFLT